MSAKPIFSVVIPTHNRKALLLRLLDALHRQSMPSGAFEILVVHNYTDDGTAEAVAELADRPGPKLHYFRKNYPGPASSRQFGAMTAQGLYIAFIDDDCVPTIDWLANAMKAFEGKATGLIVPDYGSSGANTGVLGLLQGRTLPVPGQPRRYLEKTVLIESPTLFFETCNIFYPKSVFEAVGGFSEEFLDKFYGEDTDLGWKVKQAGFQIGFNPDCLVYHEVFHVSVWRWLKEPLFFKNLPYLAKKFPELRDEVCLQYFLTAETGLYHLFLVGIVVVGFHPQSGLLLLLPYLIQRFRSGSQIRNPIMRMARVVMGIPRSAFTWWALVSGSVRARSVLL